MPNQAQVVATGLHILSASIAPVNKSSQKLTVSGSLSNLYVGSAVSVKFEAGDYNWEIDFSRFVKAGSKYTYTEKGGKFSLILNTATRGFSAKVVGLFFEQSPNPLPIKLKIDLGSSGAISQCILPQFTITPKKWSFKENLNHQYVCDAAEAPKLNVPVIFSETPSSLGITLAVNPGANFDKTSLMVYRVDDNLNILNQVAVCSMHDDGDIDKGDAVKGDNVFSCKAEIVAESPGLIRLSTQIHIGDEYVFSPWATIHVVNPLGSEAIERLVRAQSDTQTIVQGAIAGYGRTKKAGQEIVKALVKIDGIRSARLTPKASGVSLVFEPGIEASIILKPLINSENVVASMSSAQENVDDGDNRQTLSPLLAPGDTVGVKANKIPNCRVFIYAAFEEELDPDTGTSLKQLFDQSTKLGFTVDYCRNEECNLAKLAETTQKAYGTIIINSHGLVGYDNNIQILTREPVTRATFRSPLIIYAMGSGGLVITEADFFKNPEKSGWFYSFKPNYVKQWLGFFNNSVVLMASCYGAANRSMADAFFLKGAKTYYGMSDYVWTDYLEYLSRSLFINLIDDKLTTGKAFELIPNKNQDPNHRDTTAKFNRFGDTNLVYSCDKIDLSQFKNLGIYLKWHVFYLWTSSDPDVVFPHPHTESDPELGSYNKDLTTGSFTGSTFKQSWDYTIPYGHIVGSQHATVNPSVTEITGFSFSETRTTDTLLEVVSFSGRNIPLEFEDVQNHKRKFHLDGSRVCQAITNFEYSSVNVANGKTTRIDLDKPPVCNGYSWVDVFLE